MHNGDFGDFITYLLQHQTKKALFDEVMAMDRQWSVVGWFIAPRCVYIALSMDSFILW